MLTELQVVKLVQMAANGHTIRGIARSLKVSKNTVMKYRARYDRDVQATRAVYNDEVMTSQHLDPASRIQMVGTIGYAEYRKEEKTLQGIACPQPRALVES